MRRLAFAALAALLGLVVAPASGAQSEPTVTVEVRVLQNVEDGREIHIGARPAGGLWQTLGRIPLALDDGFSPRGRYRYGDISVDLGLPNRSSPVTVEVWVWQDVRDDQNIYISARGSLGEWDTLGTISLPLDDGLTPDRTLRFGDVRLEAPLPTEAVSTLAGRAGEWGYADGPGTEARFGQQWASIIRDLGLAAAPDGSVIVADRAHGAVRRVAPDGAVSTIAGGNRSALPPPSDVAVDAEGNIYVAAAWAGGLIRKFSSDGRVTSVVAGGGPEGAPFEIPPDGPAEEAYFRSVRGTALSPEGDLYVMEQYQIRRISSSGWVTHLAGGGGRGYRDGPGAQAQFTWLEDLAVDDAGTVYVIDWVFVPGEVGSFATIRKVDTNGVVTTLFRSESPFSGGVLAGPAGLAVTNDGEILISNTGRHQIVRLTADGTLEAVAGRGGWVCRWPQGRGRPEPARLACRAARWFPRGDRSGRESAPRDCSRPRRLRLHRHRACGRGAGAPGGGRARQHLRPGLALHAGAHRVGFNWQCGSRGRSIQLCPSRLAGWHGDDPGRGQRGWIP